MDPLEAISPIDGRYQHQVADLNTYFSEMALMRYRILVEAKYFFVLAEEPKVKTIRRFTLKEQKFIHDLYTNFDLKQAQQIKAIEKITKHDVKAIEYFIKQRLQRTSLKSLLEFIHFGLTSEDVNNLAYSLLLRDAIHDVYIVEVRRLISMLTKQARRYKNLAMLSLTHGQPATPTTVGKEYQVVVQRLKKQLASLEAIRYTGKFGGATGNWAAHHIAYPEVDWLKFSQKFVTSLQLTFNPTTTQIEPHDTIAEAFHAMTRVNTIIKDFDQDMWHYIARGLFAQLNTPGEIGSSAMPHKINPIYFENSEGNVGVANALLLHLAEKLPVSRMQRDLTDSTVLRNQGVAVAHSVLAVRNTIQALERVQPRKDGLTAELDQHWEVLAEAIQTVMRRLGKAAPYEQLKQLTRGQTLTKQVLHEFIEGLDIPDPDKQRLLALTPQTYIGLSGTIATINHLP